MLVIYLQIKPLLAHRTVGIALAYLNYTCSSIVFVVVFTLVGGLSLDSDSLVYLRAAVGCCWLLLLLLLISNPITNDDLAPM